MAEKQQKQKQPSSWRAKPQEQQGSHCLKAEEEVAERFKRMAGAGTRGWLRKDPELRLKIDRWM